MGSLCGGRTQFSSDDLKKDLMSLGVVGKLVKHKLLPELFRGGGGWLCVLYFGSHLWL